MLLFPFLPFLQLRVARLVWVRKIMLLQISVCGETGVAIRVCGSFIVANQFLVCGEGIKAEGMPSLDELSIDIPSKRVGQFREQFIMQPGNLMSCYYIAKQDLYIIQS